VLGFILAEAARDLRRIGRIGVSAVLLIALSIAVLGGFWLLSLNLERAVSQWRERVRVIVYLKDEPAASKLDDLLRQVTDLLAEKRGPFRALAFAREQGIPVEIIHTAEMDRPEYLRNDGARCFHCKDELFTVMESFRTARGFRTIAYGVNLDDQGDFRPGQKAAAEHQVAAPLLEAELTKQEIRELARGAGLRIWDKPASACLSSRIEYGRAVTREALSAVEQGEDALRALGFRQVRVRHHGEIVRIEIAKEELPRALDATMAAELARIFKNLGFKFVTLDLEGFRSGSMNALLPLEELGRGSVS